MSALALFAHPGHELRVLGWCMRTKPTVVILTDGQGSQDKGRLERSVGILNEIGCNVWSRSGSISDRETYEAMLAGRPDAIARFFLSVIDELDPRLDQLVFDRTEGFNPTHDLVGVVGRHLGKRLSSGRAETGPSQWAISLETLPGEDEQHPDAHALCRCTDPEFELKQRLSQSYDELAPEVERAIRQAGVETFRTEWGHPVAAGVDLEMLIPSKPAFERHGEERVARGVYSRVLRRDDHLLPFLRRLLTHLDSPR